MAAGNRSAMPSSEMDQEYGSQERVQSNIIHNIIQNILITR